MIERNMNEDLLSMLNQHGYDGVVAALKAAQKQKEAEEKARAEAERKQKEAEAAKRHAEDEKLQKEAQYIADLATRILHNSLTDKDMAFIYNRYLTSKGVDDSITEVFTEDTMGELVDMLTAFNPLLSSLKNLQKHSKDCECGECKPKVKVHTVKTPMDADEAIRRFLNTL